MRKLSIMDTEVTAANTVITDELLASMNEAARQSKDEILVTSELYRDYLNDVFDAHVIDVSLSARDLELIMGLLDEKMSAFDTTVYAEDSVGDRINKAYRHLREYLQSGITYYVNEYIEKHFTDGRISRMCAWSALPMKDYTEAEARFRGVAYDRRYSYDSQYVKQITKYGDMYMLRQVMAAANDKRPYAVTRALVMDIVPGALREKGSNLWADENNNLKEEV